MACRIGLTIVLAGLLFCSVGCFKKGAARVNQPGMDASAAGSGAMKKYDANNDGVVKGDELAKAPALKAALKSLDTDGDGGVSADEVASRVRAWQESRMGKQMVQVTVHRGGKPVKGLKVRLVPEEFLGSEILACEGTTQEQGVAALGVPGSDIPGCAPGLYRVEITSADGSIPAKYNTETTLGVEIAPDVASVQEGIRFAID